MPGEVLRLTYAELAHQLGVGEATAKIHVSHVLTKLGVRDRVQAVIYAYETGFAPAAGIMPSAPGARAGS